jgi:prepilin signal peptidase PulO-like enzyme (type II secretory pathway)
MRMYILIAISIFLLGTIIGSFLNVVIYRFNTGRSISRGRSICLSCSHTLSWYELIPVFSFLIQSGRCRSCASSISHQYPMVEFVTGLVFTLIAYHFLPVLPISQSSYVILSTIFVFLFSLLIVISVYDIRHKIIPDKLVYIFAFISFFSLFINQTGFGPLFVKPELIDIASGPLLALPFAFLWLVSRGKWMGLGDAKLVLGIGWMLGFYLGSASIILSFWIGAIFGLAMMLFSKKKIGVKTEIPFAPFLILSALLVFLYNIDIFRLTSIFSFN